MSRWDSAAIVPNTSELLPEPETPVNTVSRRLGSSTLMSLRLFTRAPCTRIRSWLSAACAAADPVSLVVAVLIVPVRLVAPRRPRFSIPDPLRCDFAVERVGRRAGQFRHHLGRGLGPGAGLDQRPHGLDGGRVEAGGRRRAAGHHDDLGARPPGGGGG